MQKKRERLLNDIPTEGFIKLSSDHPESISAADKAALIRRGNIFFNSGEYEKAKRIFITTQYTDGLIRIGDWHLKQNEPFEAVRMYWLAPAPDKVESWVSKASEAIRKWLDEN